MPPPYERLHAWRECHELALAVYDATKAFPSDERYGLTSQMRRASCSAAVNIVKVPLGIAARSSGAFWIFPSLRLRRLAMRYVLRKRPACLVIWFGSTLVTGRIGRGF